MISFMGMVRLIPATKVKKIQRIIQEISGHKACIVVCGNFICTYKDFVKISDMIKDGFPLIYVKNKIKLLHVASSLKIGGADNKKGYGGLCLRIKMPNDLSFSSDNGK